MKPYQQTEKITEYIKAMHAPKHIAGFRWYAVPAAWSEAVVPLAREDGVIPFNPQERIATAPACTVRPQQAGVAKVHGTHVDFKLGWNIVHKVAVVWLAGDVW